MSNTPLHLHRLAPLLLLIFIDSFSYFVVIPVLLQLFFNPSMGLLSPDVSQATRNLLTGVTIALSTLASLLAAPIIGSLSDRWGRKKALLLCLFAVSLGFLLPIFGIFKKSLGLILMGRFFAGMGSASQPVAQAAVADLYGHQPKQKAIALSLIAFMMTLPIILGPLAGGYLSDPKIYPAFNITTPYLFAFILAILNLFLILCFFHETLCTPTKSSMLSLWHLALDLKKALKMGTIGPLLFLFFCLELAWSQYYQSIALYLTEHFHHSPQTVSLFYTYLGLWMCLGLLLIYPILIRVFSLNFLAFIGSFLILFSLIGCTVFHMFYLTQWVFSPILALFTGMTYVSLVTLISNQVPESHQGWMMGYISTTLFFAWMLTGFDSGILISIQADLPLYLSVGLMALGLIGYYFFYFGRTAPPKST